MNEKKVVDKRVRRVQITMDVVEVPGLHEATRAFCLENDLSKFQEDMMHEAIETGALLDGIRNGRVDIHYM